MISEKDKMNLKITLYDIFGYVLPGIVFLVGIAILFWSVFYPQTHLVPVKGTTATWVSFVVLSYFSGHMLQALGNLLMKRFQSAENLLLTKNQADSLPEALVQSAKEKASSILGVDVKDISPEWLFRICDEMIVQGGITEDRELYQYREGFYRGLTIAFLVLSLSLTIRAIVYGTFIELSDSLLYISKPMLFFFIIVFFIGTWLSFFRYRRFAKYRVSHAIIGFLALQGIKSLKEK